MGQSSWRRGVEGWLGARSVAAGHLGQLRGTRGVGVVLQLNRGHVTVAGVQEGGFHCGGLGVVSWSCRVEILGNFSGNQFWLLFQFSCHLSVSPHQKHNDQDEQDVEGGKGEYDRVLPVGMELLLLLLLPLLSLLWVDCRCHTGAGHRVVGVILRAGIRGWAEALARLVIPSSTSLQAGRGGRGVPAVAAARLLPPLLVRGPAAGRLQATPTPTGKLVLHLQGGALLLA